MTEKMLEDKIALLIPQDVEFIVSSLMSRGYSAYIVGGCVRDIVLGRVPHDWDVCTSATPQEAAGCFPDLPVLMTGAKHGTITVMGERPVEVTTFRIDSGYSDGRHPDKVSFVSDIILDLSRRDFTMNAIAFGCEADGNFHLVDPFGGLRDIEKRIIRTVGSAEERFHEDALRILRALRFASVLSFDIDPDTVLAMHMCRALLMQVSSERQLEELNKIIASRDGYVYLDEYSDIVFMSFACSCDSEEYKRSLRALSVCKTDDISTRFGIILRSATNQAAESVVKRLKMPRVVSRSILNIVKNRAYVVPDNKCYIKKGLNEFGIEQYRRILEVSECFAYANRSFSEMKRISEARIITEKIIESGECFSLDSLSITGDDLKALGFAEGSEIGSALKKILNEVIMGRLSNDKESIFGYVRNKMQERVALV